jgi:MinD-like ATPase involved in chromosome partitioning or flagellar assembly
MLLGIITNLDGFKHEFENYKNVNVIVRQNVVENMFADMLLLINDTIETSELKLVRNMYPDVDIYYVMTDFPGEIEFDKVKAITSAYKIKMTPVLSDVKSISEHFKSILAKTNKRKKIFSFFGTHSGAGNSTTVLNTASTIGTMVRPATKITVLSLNPYDSSDYFLNYNGSHLEDIKIELSKDFDEAKLMNAMCHYKEHGFNHLAGNTLKMKIHDYTEDEIEHLIKVANRLSDIVLIDGGTFFDNACYAMAYEKADVKFLVTTQEEKGFNSNWKQTYSQMVQHLQGSLQTNLKDYLLILNRYNEGVSLIDEKDLSEQMGMALLGTIPDMDMYGPLAIAEKRLLLDVADKHYRKSLESIARSIMGFSQIHEIERSDEKRSFFKKLVRRSS